MERRNTKNDSIKTRNFPAFNTATTGINEGNLIGIAGAFKNGKTTRHEKALLKSYDKLMTKLVFL
jgi:hypothetical protein